MVGPMGALNGYVRIPEDHPWHGKWGPFCGHSGCYEHTIEGMIAVHGGITFGGGKPMGVDEGDWIGFDCSHAGDLVPGLDFMDGEYRDEQYVRGQCERIADQLVTPRMIPQQFPQVDG